MFAMGPIPDLCSYVMRIPNVDHGHPEAHGADSSDE